MADKDSLVVLHVHFVPASIGYGGCYTILGKTVAQRVRRTGVSPLTLSCVVFAAVVSGVFAGMLPRRLLPAHHLSDDSKEVIRLGAGLIATVNALVLGLLIASAKGSFETQSGHVRQMTASAILLDRILARYGAETRGVREELRQSLERVVAQIWSENAVPSSITPFQATMGELTVIHGLSPQNDVQRSLKIWAVEISAQWVKSRLLLFAQKDNPVPTPFLSVLVFWLTIIFASFSLFAPPNATVRVALLIFAFSAATAIFLILELSQPFLGLMQISPAPLLNALGPLGP